MLRDSEFLRKQNCQLGVVSLISLKLVVKALKDRVEFQPSKCFFTNILTHTVDEKHPAPPGMVLKPCK